MYQYENAIATNITNINLYHSINNFGAGSLLGFTFKIGASASIASVANYSGTIPGTVLITTTTPHNLLTGEPVTQVGTVDYNGVYTVTFVTINSYYITHAFTSTRTGSVSRGSTLQVNPGSNAAYVLAFSVTAFPSNSTDTFKFELFQNATSLDNIVASRRFQTSTDYSGMSSSGIVNVAVGDYIWFGCMNQTSTGNVTVRHSNVNLNKI